MPVPRHRRRVAGLHALSGRRATLAVAIGVACAAWRGIADGHPLDFSSFYAEATEANVRVSFDLHPNALREALPALDVDRDGALSADEVARSGAALTDLLDRGVTLAADGQPCRADPPSAPRLAAGVRVKIDRAYRCPRAPRALDWTVHALTDIEGGHSIVGRTRLGGGYDQFVFKAGVAQHAVLAGVSSSPSARPSAEPTATASNAEVPERAPPPPVATGFRSFLGLGVEHILRGFDHLCFVLALALAARRFRDLALVVTAFTAAHSITLALGALDLVRLSSRIVEPAIAASIVWVAVDNVRRESPRHRAPVAFAFGLLHGFGFSSALRDAGLPTNGLVSALFAFNLGVELGQLAFVAPAFVAIARFVRGRSYERRVVRSVSLAIAAAGAAWLIDRVVGSHILP